MPKQVQVYLDTNVLLLPGREKLDIFAEIEKLIPHAICLILPSVQQELEHLAINEKKSLKDRSAAKLGLLLIKQKSLKMVRGSSTISADEALLMIATPEDYVVTQDKELSKRLQAKDIHVITVRQKSKMHLR